MFSINLIFIPVVYLTLRECASFSSKEDSGNKSDSTYLENVLEFFLSVADNNRLYHLYTRKNPIEPQNITYGNEDTLVISNYDPRKELIVIVHGWGADANASVYEAITSSYLKAADVNVIVIDWGIEDEYYLSAYLRVVSTGRYLADFVQWVFDTADGDWNRVHLIGYSLGAHVVGSAGHKVGGRPKRVTGLDPAGPLWLFSPYSLNTDSGQYVEVIHTNVLKGQLTATGHVDFYPNGGLSQPGCEDSSCSHDRAYKLFASSLVNEHLVGRRCRNAFFAIVGKCSGESLAMGNADLLKTGSGIYYLSTKDTWPF